MSITIKCPKCGRALGDTAQSIDANINCKRCGVQHIKFTVTNHADYLKGETNDKSK